MSRGSGLALALLSAAVVGYEVLLIRLLAIVQWPQFTYLVISIALLGFGASGSFLALTRRWLAPRFDWAFAVNAALFALLSMAAFLLAQRLPFNAPAVVWEPRQLFFLLLLCLLFVPPFFCGATCIGLAFVRYSGEIGRVYLYNLVGSGLGGGALVLGLFLLPPDSALRAVAGLAVVSALLVWPGGARRRAVFAMAAVTLLLMLAAAPASWTAMRISPFKPQSQALQVAGARVIDRVSNPMAQLTLLENRQVPLRHVPGLSLNSRVSPPPQLGVFGDGAGLDVITAFDGDLAPFAYLDDVLSALPYHLLEQPTVLLLGAGGGAGVLQALYHQARHIDAVESNPGRIALVRRHDAFAGGLYDRPEVRLHDTVPRTLLARTAGQWDLIQIPLLGSAAGSADSLSEGYDFTLEAFTAYLRHLRPGGLLAVTRRLRLPPRESLRLFATARQALEEIGVAEPQRHLALLRGWNTVLILVARDPLTAAQGAAVRAFAASRSFDLAFLPGLTVDETNRFNILEQPVFFAAAQALAGPRAADFLRRYKFDVAPVTDDRPYVSDFFRWRSLPEFSDRLARGAGLLEWSYPILWATLLQVGLLSLLLILLPLKALKARGGTAHRGRVCLYFTCLGLAFFFLEIAFIQRFTLFLGAPLYAAAVVIAGFLIFAGLGSGCSAALERRLAAAAAPLTALSLAVLAIVGLTLVYLAALPPLLAAAIALPEAGRLAVALLVIAPLAFFMGMPFPLGLGRVEAAAPALLPWAWGVNGCTSVVAVLAAQILALHAGFSAVLLAAMLIYLGAALVFRRWPGTAA